MYIVFFRSATRYVLSALSLKMPCYGIFTFGIRDFALCLGTVAFKSSSAVLLCIIDMGIRRFGSPYRHGPPEEI